MLGKPQPLQTLSWFKTRNPKSHDLNRPILETPHLVEGGCSAGLAELHVAAFSRVGRSLI